MLNGLLVIDKPVNWTSHDVVARLRRLTGERRIGHAGTLDPFATGVLPTAVGRATRLLQYIQAQDKRYLATIALGIETDSGDLTGQPLDPPFAGAWPTRAEVEATLSQFIGDIEQVPPVFSAIKVGGERLYHKARKGEDVSAPPRQVHVHALNLLAYDPPYLMLDVHCGKGTYIRAIARDIGRVLGCGGYCHALRRTSVGPFCLGDAWTLEALADRDLAAMWPQTALHPDMGMLGVPAAIMNEDDALKWYHGRLIRPLLAGRHADDVVRVYGPEGEFAGLGELAPEGALKPALVFATEEKE